MLAFELALKVGEENPYDLLRRIPSSLWDEWRAFNTLSPVGAWRIDMLFARLAAQLTAAVLAPWTKNRTGHTAANFLPDWDGSRHEITPEDEVPGRDPGTMLAKFKEWAAALPAVIVRRDDNGH